MSKSAGKGACRFLRVARLGGQRLGAAGDHFAGGSETDDAQRTGGEPLQLGRFGAGLAEAAGAHVLLHPRQLAGEGQQHGHDVVGHFLGAEEGGIGDDDAAFRGLCHGDFIGAVAEARDQAAAVQRCDHGRGQAG